jgi:hypothetical protein
MKRASARGEKAAQKMATAMHPTRLILTVGEPSYLGASQQVVFTDGAILAFLGRPVGRNEAVNMSLRRRSTSDAPCRGT